MRKAQTSTEYLIILAVVIVIALVAINTLGGFPSIGANSVKKISELKLQTDTIGIESYSIGANSSLFKIKNNYFDTITVTEFRVNQQSNLTCNSSNTVPSLPIVLNVGQSMIINCSIVNSSSYTITTKQTPVIGISYTDNLGATRSAGNAPSYNLTISGSGSGQGESQVSAWWNQSYAYRKQINITTSVNLTSDYTATITVDTASLVSGGKLQSSGNDLRIVYSNGGIFTELDRINETPFNNAVTNISFKLSAAANVGSAELTKYFIYYGNSSVTNPPAYRDQIYLFYDNFETNASLNFSKWAKWTDGSSDVYTQNVSGNNVLRLYTDGSHRTHASTVNQFIPPIEVNFDWTYPHAWDMLQVATRSDGTGVSSATGGLRNGAEFYYYDGWASNTMGSYAINVYNPNPTNVTSLVQTTTGNFISINVWHNVRMIDTNSSLYWDIDNVRVLSQVFNGTFATNKVSFCAREFNYARYIDNVKIKRYALTTPTYTLATEELKF